MKIENSKEVQEEGIWIHNERGNDPPESWWVMDIPQGEGKSSLSVELLEGPLGFWKQDFVAIFKDAMKFCQEGNLGITLDQIHIWPPVNDEKHHDLVQEAREEVRAALAVE